MNKIAAFVLSLFLCACNSSQKANMDNIISFEGINIETDITSFCDSLEKRGYEKIAVPNDAQSDINSAEYRRESLRITRENVSKEKKMR